MLKKPKTAKQTYCLKHLMTDSAWDNSWPEYAIKHGLKIKGPIPMEEQTNQAGAVSTHPLRRTLRGFY